MTARILGVGDYQALIIHRATLIDRLERCYEMVAKDGLTPHQTKLVNELNNQLEQTERDLTAHPYYQNMRKELAAMHTK